MADATALRGIDPGYDGYAGTNRLLATATNGPDQANGWLQNAQGRVALQQHEYDLGTARATAFKNAAASIMQNPTADNLNSVLTEGVKSGTIPADMVSQALATTSGMSDQQRQQWALNHWMTVADHQQQMDTAFGRPALVDNGNALQPFMVKQGPQGGYSPAPGGTASIPLQLGPRDRINTQQGLGPNGQAGNYPVGQLYDNAGNFRGAGAGAGAAPAAPQQPQPGQGVPQAGAGQPSATPAPSNPQSAPVANPGAPGASAGFVPTSLSPGQRSAVEGSADTWRSLASDVASPSGVGQRINMLQNALGALRGASTGLGSAGRQKIMSYLANLPGASGFIPNDVASKLNDYDLANKYLTAYALNTPGAARSDAGLNTAGAANASTSINPGAAQEVTLNNIGLERMKQAQAQAFIQSGQDPGGYSNWSAQFNRNLDPKAFALGDMTPQERQKLYSGLKGKALTNFNATVRVGLKTGILDRGDLAGAAGNGQ